MFSRARRFTTVFGDIFAVTGGALADTLQMGPPERKFMGWDPDLSPRDASPKRGRTRSRSRRPVALAMVFIAVAFLGTVWYFGMNLADVGGIILEGVDNAVEYGGSAFENVGDMAGNGSVVLDDLRDTAREVADMVEQSVDDLMVESVAEPVDEPPVDAPDTATPASPLDRTIYPDGSTHSPRDATQEQAAPAPKEEPVPRPTKAEQIEDLIHTMTNQHRVLAGLHPLDRIPKIDQIARSHSEDMAKRNYFQHDTPEGLDPTDRGNAAGYSCRKDYGSYYTFGLAENISYHDGTWYGATRLANEIMNGWMNSPGHYRNIMEPSYDRIGIGVAASAGAVYATQNFC